MDDLSPRDELWLSATYLSCDASEEYRARARAAVDACEWAEHGECFVLLAQAVMDYLQCDVLLDAATQRSALKDAIMKCSDVIAPVADPDPAPHYSWQDRLDLK